MPNYEIEQRYKKYWVGKYCRVGSYSPFRLVVDVNLYGPPSFVYGSAGLVFEDGSEVMINQGGAFRPRKMDVEVKNE